MLSKLDEPDLSKWAKIAITEKLAPLELKRSIEAGKVMRLSDLATISGQSSRINTIEGVVFRMRQWEASMGGSDSILALPSDDLEKLLKLLTPAVELASKIEHRLHPDD